MHSDNSRFIATSSMWIHASLLGLGASCCRMGLLVAVVAFVLIDAVVCKYAVTIACIKTLTDLWIATCMWWPSFPGEGCCTKWWCPLATTTCFQGAWIQNMVSWGHVKRKELVYRPTFPRSRRERRLFVFLLIRHYLLPFPGSTMSHNKEVM